MQHICRRRSKYSSLFLGKNAFIKLKKDSLIEGIVPYP